MTDAQAETTGAPWLKLDWFPAGYVLIPQGDKLGKLFVLREGEVQIERDGTYISSTGQPGSIFGEMSLLLEKPHTATVAAVSEVECYVIEDALRVLEAHPAWTLQIARLLAQRVNSTTAALMEARPGRDDEDGERLIMPHYIISDWADPQV